MLGRPGLWLVPEQRLLPPTPERGPLRGRLGWRVPAGAGACPLPALRGAPRLSCLHSGACQAMEGKSQGQGSRIRRPGVGAGVSPLELALASKGSLVYSGGRQVGHCP